MLSRVKISRMLLTTYNTEWVGNMKKKYYLIGCITLHVHLNNLERIIRRNFACLSFLSDHYVYLTNDFFLLNLMGNLDLLT